MYIALRCSDTNSRKACCKHNTSRTQQLFCYHRPIQNAALGSVTQRCSWHAASSIMLQVQTQAPALDLCIALVMAAAAPSPASAGLTAAGSASLAAAASKGGVTAAVAA